MPLTEVQCRNAKPQGKSFRLYDAAGLYLEVTPQGGKYFRLKYRVNGQEKRLALGVYPTVSLKEAREKRDDARRQMGKGIDPSQAKQAAKLAAAGAETFEAIAREWHAKHKHKWKPGTADKLLRSLEVNIFPWLGRKSVDQITPPELLATLRRAEGRGAVETAHRLRSWSGQVFRYAIATGRAERDPAQDLKGAIPPAPKRHFPTMTDPLAVGELLRAIEGYQGSFAVQCALRLAPMLFVRPGELRKAEWSEFDFEKAEWRIPASKMKMGVQHLVPLPRQAVEIIQTLRGLTGHGAAAKYLFPSVRTLARPMSDNTLNSALRRLGYFEVTYDLCLGEEPFYLLLRYARQGRKVELKIPMEATHPHLGGERFWFRCPVTGKRCAVLYLPWGALHFASREAYCMAYSSQNKSHLERSWDKRLGNLDLIPRK